MGVASGFSWGSGVIGWAAADLQWMVTEVLCAIKDRTILAQKMSLPLYAYVTISFDWLHGFE